MESLWFGRQYYPYGCFLVRHCIKVDGYIFVVLECVARLTCCQIIPKEDSFEESRCSIANAKANQFARRYWNWRNQRPVSEASDWRRRGRRTRLEVEAGVTCCRVRPVFAAVMQYVVFAAYRDVHLRLLQLFDFEGACVTLRSALATPNSIRFIVSTKQCRLGGCTMFVHEHCWGFVRQNSSVFPLSSGTKWFCLHTNETCGSSLLVSFANETCFSSALLNVYKCRLLWRIVRTLETRGWLPRELAASELEERELLTERDINLIDEVHSAYRDSLDVHLERRAGQRHQPMMDDLVNFAELSVRRVIDMSKKIEEFRLLSQEDQISLLKGGAVELLILRGLLCFDGDNQRFLEESDQEERDTMSAIDFLQGAGENGAGALFMQLWRSLLKELECDKTTLLLLLVICLFSSDRAHVPLESKTRIEEVQLRYCMLMEKYIQTRARSVREARRIYPLVLSKLSDLRSINEEFSKRMITVNPQIIQPLMSELFDLSEVKNQAEAEASELAGAESDVATSLGSPLDMDIDMWAAV